MNRISGRVENTSLLRNSVDIASYTGGNIENTTLYQPLWEIVNWTSGRVDNTSLLRNSVEIVNYTSGNIENTTLHKTYGKL